MGKRGRPTFASQGKQRRSDAQRSRESYKRKQARAQLLEGTRITRKEVLLVEAAFREPTRGILEGMINKLWASQVDERLSEADFYEICKSWAFIQDYVSEAMPEIESDQR
jgi:hypothetical protein